MCFRYPDYEILGDPQIAKTAAVSTRYSDGALNGLIQDLYFLSQSDYLVCTFSSQVFINLMVYFTLKYILNVAYNLVSIINYFLVNQLFFANQQTMQIFPMSR